MAGQIAERTSGISEAIFFMSLGSISSRCAPIVSVLTLIRCNSSHGFQSFRLFGNHELTGTEHLPIDG